MPMLTPPSQSYLPQAGWPYQCLMVATTLGLKPKQKKKYVFAKSHAQAPDLLMRASAFFPLSLSFSQQSLELRLVSCFAVINEL